MSASIRCASHIAGSEGIAAVVDLHIRLLSLAVVSYGIGSADRGIAHVPFAVRLHIFNLDALDNEGPGLAGVVVQFAVVNEQSGAETIVGVGSLLELCEVCILGVGLGGRRTVALRPCKSKGDARIGVNPLVFAVGQTAGFLLSLVGLQTGIPLGLVLAHPITLDGDFIVAIGEGEHTGERSRVIGGVINRIGLGLR